MKIIEKGVLDLTGRELRQCRSLSMRSDGLMCDDLTEWRMYESRPNRFKRKARVWMVKEGDTLLSWALVTPRVGQSGYDAQFYTRRTERGKGYATALMARVRNYAPKPYVFPHDAKSGKFFKKNRNMVTIQRHFEMWVM